GSLRTIPKYSTQACASNCPSTLRAPRCRVTARLLVRSKHHKTRERSRQLHCRCVYLSAVSIIAVNRFAAESSSGVDCTWHMRAVQRSRNAFQALKAPHFNAARVRGNKTNAWTNKHCSSRDNLRKRRNFITISGTLKFALQTILTIYDMISDRARKSTRFRCLEVTLLAKGAYARVSFVYIL